MAERSNQVSRVMQEHVNLQHGDVVCVFMPNCAEYVWTWLGMAKVGAVSALINSNLRHKPLLHCIQVAKAKAIVFSESLAGGKSLFYKFGVASEYTMQLSGYFRTWISGTNFI